MNRSIRFYVLFLLTAMLGLAACSEEVVIPDPVPMTRESVGFYCNMIVVDHPGPKSQVFEDGVETPFWFSSVRDAVFYNSLPGEGTRILVTYVQDSAAIQDWNNPPEDGPWIKLMDAIFVIESSKRGGMGARETVPFSNVEDAEKFRSEFGGQVVSYSNIPVDYLTGY